MECMGTLLHTQSVTLHKSNNCFKYIRYWRWVYVCKGRKDISEGFHNREIWKVWAYPWLCGSTWDKLESEIPKKVSKFRVFQLKEDFYSCVCVCTFHFSRWSLVFSLWFRVSDLYNLKKFPCLGRKVNDALSHMRLLFYTFTVIVSCVRDYILR